MPDQDATVAALADIAASRRVAEQQMGTTTRAGTDEDVDMSTALQHRFKSSLGRLQDAIGDLDSKFMLKFCMHEERIQHVEESLDLEIVRVESKVVPDRARRVGSKPFRR
eukprot:SAG31_NODE_1818_length_7201_cov_11.041819_7_plen_110_part_00